MLYYLPNVIAQIFLLIFTQTGLSDRAVVEPVGALPADLNECSGIARLQPNRLVMINDSGNDPILWVVDTLGRLCQKVELTGLENRDWESLAHNDSLLFVGDIGNNANERRDLRIHFFKWQFQDDSLHLEGRGRLDFRYRDQIHYPPFAERRHYDAEALIAAEDSLYIFTKSRAKPFQGISYCYGLPARAGLAEAIPLDSVVTGPGVRVSHWISAADYDAAHNRLALLSYDRVWVFEQVQPPHFFAHPPESLALGFLSQMEGLAWRDAHSLWLTNERNDKRSGKLYKAHLKP